MRARFLGPLLLAAGGCVGPGSFGGHGEPPSILGPDPERPGALVCRLPVRPDGSLAAPGEHGSVTRPVSARLVYWLPDEGGRLVVRPFVHLWPVDPPRKPWVAQLEGPGGPTPAYGVFDRSTLLRARAGSPQFAPKPGNVAGSPGWWILNPFHCEDSGWFLDQGPAVMIGEFYLQDPGTGAMPVDLSVVARLNPGTIWEPVHWWLLTRDRAIGAAAVVENGQPVGVAAYDIPEPPLDPLLVGRENLVVACGRWRNRLLIQAKNSTLPNLLRDQKTPELSALVVRIEQLVLDLNHEAELARDRAQWILESGKGDPANDREWGIVYRERIEILKPMLSAIRDEISNRNR